MRILITGASNGMGKGVARALAKSSGDNELILLCRSEKAGRSAIEELKGISPNIKASLVLCDLTKLSDVKAAIKSLKTQFTSLDALFINAGLGYAPKQVLTEDGLDSHFQVNYLSQYLLTNELIPLLERSENGGRVIFNVTKYGEIFWDDMQMEKKWSYERGIFQGMAAKRMFISKLNKLHSNSRLSFIGFSIHKTVWTNQLNRIPSWMRFMASVMKLFGTFISIDECGEVIAPLFNESQEKSLKRSGKLISWKKGEYPEIHKEAMEFSDEELQRLWDVSQKLTEV